MKKMSRVLTLVLALALCFTCMAVPVFAEDEPGNENPVQQTGSYVDERGEEFTVAPDDCICQHWCGYSLNSECTFCSQVGSFGMHPWCAKTRYVQWDEENKDYSESFGVPHSYCTCTQRCTRTNWNTSCLYCRQTGSMGNHPACHVETTEEMECTCEVWCNNTNTNCVVCNQFGYLNPNTCAGRRSESSASSPSDSEPSTSSHDSGKSAPDVSGHYRTSMNKILATVTPEVVAQQELAIDAATNTVLNLYDSEGNLIPCTLSSDGHFYIVPVNEGYVYIPTGR